MFGKLARLITMESKKAAGNMSSPGLRAVMERAKKEYMSSDIINHAVKKVREVMQEKWTRCSMKRTGQEDAPS